MFPPLAERLARAGFATVMMNVSGSGVDDAGELVWPERFGHNTYSRELDDLGRVVDALAAGGLGVAPPSALGMVGHSRGGGMAILQAARDPRVGALVTWSAISSVERSTPQQVAAWREKGSQEIVNARTGQRLPLYTDQLDDIEANAAGSLNIAAAASRLQIPWLIIHGAEDESVSPLEAEALRAASTLPGTRRLEIAGAGHTFGAGHPWDPRKHDTAELRRVFDMTLAWFAAHLG